MVFFLSIVFFHKFWVGRGIIQETWMQKDHSKCQVCEQVGEVFINSFWLNLDLEIKNTPDKNLYFHLSLDVIVVLPSVHIHIHPQLMLCRQHQKTRKRMSRRRILKVKPGTHQIEKAHYCHKVEKDVIRNCIESWAIIF